MPPSALQLDLIINNATPAIIPAEARSRLGEDTKNVLLGIAVPWDVLLEDVTLTILNPMVRQQPLPCRYP